VKVPAVPAEYQWIDAHYPGSRLNMQALSECAGSPTDQFHITTADGRNLTVLRYLQLLSDAVITFADARTV